MRRNCSLQLGLATPSTDYINGDCSFEDSNEKEKRLTIFYNGRLLTAADVTELQAKSIISLASREMEKSSTPSPTNCVPSSPMLESYLYTPTGNSMRRSLQRFLQKRKTRAQEACPYHHH